MLAGYDMFYVVSEEGLGRLWKVTIFATMTGTLPDKVTQSRIHQAALPVAKTRRTLAWSIETKLPTPIKVSYSSRSSAESETCRLPRAPRRRKLANRLDDYSGTASALRCVFLAVQAITP
jgi:hypothetical protein